MEFKDLLELIKTVNESDIADFKLKNGEYEVRITSGKFSPISKGGNQTPATVAPVQVAPTPAPTPVQVAPAPVVTQPDQAQGGNADTAEPSTAGLLEIKSPIVGTFYRSPSPDKPAYIKVGDTIQDGDVVCIVEAMKLFNEIESEISGKIVKVMVEDASPVEYDQVLFLVEPA